MANLSGEGKIKVRHKLDSQATPTHFLPCDLDLWSSDPKSLSHYGASKRSISVHSACDFIMQIYKQTDRWSLVLDAGNKCVQKTLEFSKYIQITSKLRLYFRF